MTHVILNFFLIINYCFPQTENWQEVAKIKHQAEFITTDQLGNLYLANENFIWLYNNKGDSIGAFNSRKYGSISHVDATDPYKVLVFFSDYNLILFLDNYLSINGEAVDLQELGYDQISMACQSRATGIWIYDQLKQKAIHLDDNYKADKQTVNLYQWFGKRIMPSSMIEFNNTLFINEPNSGIYVFDHFATYQKTIPLVGIKDFQVYKEGIRYFHNGNYCNYTFKNFSENCKPFFKENVENIRMEKSKVYTFNSKEVTIYSTN